MSDWTKQVLKALRARLNDSQSNNKPLAAHAIAQVRRTTRVEGWDYAEG